jgi:hypothetical protein
MSTSSAESAQTIYINQPKIKPIFLFNTITNNPALSFNPPSLSSSSSICSISSQPIKQAVPIFPINHTSLACINPSENSKTILNNESSSSTSKLTQNLIKHKNEQLLNEFHDRLNNMIDTKLDSFLKLVNNLTFKNASRCGKSYKDIKHNKISNNQLNKLTRLHDLIDVNKFKNTKNNKRINTDKFINEEEGSSDANTVQQSEIDQNEMDFVIESRRKSITDDLNEPISPSFSNISDAQTISSIVNSSLIDNIIPVLSITSENRSSKPSVILTWDLFKINEDKFIDSKDPFLLTIKEYEIHGYKEEPEHLSQLNEAAWVIVSLFILPFFVFKIL